MIRKQMTASDIDNKWSNLVEALEVLIKANDGPLRKIYQQRLKLINVRRSELKNMHSKV